MNAISFPRRFPCLPALRIVTFSGGRGTHLKCALLGTDQGSSAEVRWLYKTARYGKQELILDADAVPPSAGGDRHIPMEHSRAARQSHWTGLMQGPGEGSGQPHCKRFCRRYSRPERASGECC